MAEKEYKLAKWSILPNMRSDEALNAAAKELREVFYPGSEDPAERLQATMEKALRMLMEKDYTIDIGPGGSRLNIQDKKDA